MPDAAPPHACSASDARTHPNLSPRTKRSPRPPHRPPMHRARAPNPLPHLDVAVAAAAERVPPAAAGATAGERRRRRRRRWCGEHGGRARRRLSAGAGQSPHPDNPGHPSGRGSPRPRQRQRRRAAGRRRRGCRRASIHGADRRGHGLRARGRVPGAGGRVAEGAGLPRARPAAAAGGRHHSALPRRQLARRTQPRPAAGQPLRAPVPARQQQAAGSHGRRWQLGDGLSVHRRGCTPAPHRKSDSEHGVRRFNG